MECIKYVNLFEQTFKKCDITYDSSSNNCIDLNCFIEMGENETYPPRVDFEEYSYKGIKENNVYILKFKENGIIKFAVNDKIIKIIDVFIDINFQNSGIMKKIISYLEYFTKKYYPTIEYISLLSLTSGIIPWYKIGFQFYNKAHKYKIINIISNKLGNKINLDQITKAIIEKHDILNLLNQNNIKSVPMLKRIK